MRTVERVCGRVCGPSRPFTRSRHGRAGRGASYRYRLSWELLCAQFKDSVLRSSVTFPQKPDSVTAIPNKPDTVSEKTRQSDGSKPDTVSGEYLREYLKNTASDSEANLSPSDLRKAVVALRR